MDPRPHAAAAPRGHRRQRVITSYSIHYTKLYDYVGALLLGAAYLAVGQFVSALTENQILAFILALVLCMTLWGLGTEMFTGLFSDRTAGLLRSLGTGSRFDSIARGRNNFV